MSGSNNSPWSTAQWAAPVLLLITPVVIFVRYNAYPLTAPETLICLGVFALLGVSLACLTAAIGDWLRIPLFAVLTVLFVDVQSGEAVGSATSLALIAGGVVAIGLLLRAHVSSVVCVVAGSILVSSIVLPVDDRLTAGFTPGALPPLNRSLPPVVHIVLDEQIGIEGIPRSVDPRGERVDAIKKLFLDRKFTVYGKAYSFSSGTRDSMMSTLNFTTDRGVAC